MVGINKNKNKKSIRIKWVKLQESISQIPTWLTLCEGKKNKTEAEKKNTRLLETSRLKSAV